METAGHSRVLRALAREEEYDGSSRARDVPVSFGGALFTPGDWVYADADGVLVSRDKLV